MCGSVWKISHCFFFFFNGCIHIHSTMDFLYGEGDLLLKGKLALDIGYGAENPSLCHASLVEMVDNN